LREIGVTPWVVAPEPNTWRELLAAVDEEVGRLKPTPAPILAGQRIAVQEYGASPAELIDGLETRGANVTRVPVYRWELPEDLQPMRDAIDATVRGELDVALFTTSTQAVHLFRIAAESGKQDALRDRLRKMVIASIGPTTSDELREHGLQVDLEASHPKMGFLVREAAERSAELLRAKRG
jgi:uroporphyrinogen-III synthase